LSDFNETRLLSTDFPEYSNIKIHENPSNLTRVVPCARTDRHDEAKSRFPQICEGAQ